jgi:hypothetical protein
MYYKNFANVMMYPKYNNNMIIKNAYFEEIFGGFQDGG